MVAGLIRAGIEHLSFRLFSIFDFRADVFYGFFLSNRRHEYNGDYGATGEDDHVDDIAVLQFRKRLGIKVHSAGNAADGRADRRAEPDLGIVRKPGSLTCVLKSNDIFLTDVMARRCICTGYQVFRQQFGQRGNFAGGIRQRGSLSGWQRVRGGLQDGFTERRGRQKGLICASRPARSARPFWLGGSFRLRLQQRLPSRHFSSGTRKLDRHRNSRERTS